MEHVKVHELKVLDTFYPSLLDMSKPFEMRKNDRGYEVGDTCIFKEMIWDCGTLGEDRQFDYTGHKCVRHVSYVLTHEMWNAVPEGFVILGLKEVL